MTPKLQQKYPFLNLEIGHTEPRLAYITKSPLSGKNIVMPKVDESWSYDYVYFRSKADAYRYMIATLREVATEILEDTACLEWKTYNRRAYLYYSAHAGNIGCGKYINGAHGNWKWIKGYWLNGCPSRLYAIRFSPIMSEEEVKKEGIHLLRRCCRRFLKNEILP